MPRPVTSAAAAAQTPQVSAADRKALKKLKYLPVDLLPSFFGSLAGTDTLDLARARCSFGQGWLAEKVALRGEEPEPYAVGLYSFHADCGLYGLLLCEAEETLREVLTLLELLGLRGIGGKTSTGYGKFTVAETLYPDERTEGCAGLLVRRLARGRGGRVLSLTTSFPTDGELDSVVSGACCQLTRRGGFVQLAQQGAAYKKRTQYFFAAGSTFAAPYAGEVFDVSPVSSQPVWRYAKPIFLEVTV